MSGEQNTDRSGATPEGEREATERANRRAITALFMGIVVLAVIGVSVSAIAASMMGPRHQAMLATASASSSSVSTAGASKTISLWVAPSWKKGADGQLHDAYSQTNFTVRAGQPLRLVIDNRDESPHSITSAEAGVNIVVQPGVHTYTLIVQHAGTYKWICAYPCDPYSMGRPGYMAGYIRAS
jgi:plastocyanin